MNRGLNPILGLNEPNIPKFFDVLPFTSIKGKVHPCVIFTILDSFVRREKNQEFVIGTLLGVINDGNTVEITDCFVDPHSHTTEGIQIVKDQHELMYELKHKVNPKEQVVGWFYTGPKMDDVTCAVNLWFKQNVNNISKFHAQPPLTEPIQLLVDTHLSNETLKIKAYLQVSLPMVKDVVSQFHEIPLEIFSSQADHIGTATLLKALKTNKRPGQSIEPISSKDSLQTALLKLHSLLEKCTQYVQGVANGTEKPDPEVGRYLSRALDINFIGDGEHFDTMLQNFFQDNLMISHLSALVQLNFEMAEKLDTSFY